MTTQVVIQPTIKALRLRPGDMVGIAAPAWPYALHDKLPLQRGLESIQRLGLRVRVAANALELRAPVVVSPQQRADDLNNLFADQTIRAIFCLGGGANAQRVLPLLDWETITRHPKIIMGYSAVTALLVGIHARTGLTTFHGPMLLNGFSEFPDLLPFTRQQLEQLLFQAEPGYRLSSPLEWTTDFPRDDQPRLLQPNPGWRWLRPGQGQGWLLGGNLNALRSLAGTDSWPSFQGAILFIEEVNMGFSFGCLVQESLAHLQLLGVFDEIAGFVVGKVNDLSEDEQHKFEQIIADYVAPYDFPVLINVDLGHTDPRLILPLGVQASLDADADLFSLDEAAVS